MKVIIGGCGRVGAALAARLTLENHVIAVIDHKEEAFERLSPSFAGTLHVGKVFDRRTLEEAGIDHADAFVSVTSGDNSNIVSAVIAKEEFRVPHVLSRIYDPRRAEIYRRLGIPAISSVAWSVNEVLCILLHPEISTDLTFGDGEVRLVSAEVPHRLVGRRVRDLLRPGEVEAVAIVRAGRSFMPAGDDTFAPHDIVHLAVTEAAQAHVKDMLRP